jgi:hypothetical protein
MVPQPVHGESVQREFHNFAKALQQLREPLLFAPYETTPSGGCKDPFPFEKRSFEHPGLLPCTFHFRMPLDNPECNAEINYELLRRESIQSRVSIPVSDTARCADELLRLGYLDDALFLYEKFHPHQLRRGSDSQRSATPFQYLLDDIRDDDRRREVFIQLWIASKDASALSENLSNLCGYFLDVLNKNNEIQSLMSFLEKFLPEAFPLDGHVMYRGSWRFKPGRHSSADRESELRYPSQTETWTLDFDRACEDAKEAQRAAFASHGIPVVAKVEKVRVFREDVAVLIMHGLTFAVIRKPSCLRKPRAFEVK